MPIPKRRVGVVLGLTVDVGYWGGWGRVRMDGDAWDGMGRWMD